MTLLPSSSVRGGLPARWRTPRPAARTRSGALFSIAVAVMLIAPVVAPPAAAQDDCGPHVPRLRPVDPSARAVITDGCRRSPTFRRLVDEIEQSDVFVYVEASRNVPRSMQAFMQLAGANGRFRYLRIVLRLPASTETLVAQLGHEMQHITEVSHAPAVRDQRAMEALYRVIGDESGAGWDTAAARATGRQVLDELRHRATPVPAEIVVVSASQHAK